MKVEHDKDYAGFIIQCGGPGEMGPRFASETAVATRLALELYPAAVIGWWMPGYDNDPRSLWEIPEAKEQIRLTASLTGWDDAYRLPLKNMTHSLIVLLVMCGVWGSKHPFTVNVTTDAEEAARG